MKNKGIGLFLIVALLIVVVALPVSAQTKQLKNIGLYTFIKIKGQVPTAEVMKMLFEKYSSDIKTGFDIAGYPELYEPFMSQLKDAECVDTTLPIGDKMIWMMFRSRDQVKVVQDIEWAGKEPLPVFKFDVKKDWKIYQFVIPKPCGNIALYKIEEAIRPAICSLVVVPERANINDPVTVDMSGTQNARSMKVDVFDSAGNKIASKELTPDSPKWQTKFDKSGEYSFKGEAVNIEGIVSTNPCESKTYINIPPVCKLWTSCMPCEDYVGRPITFDASGSSDPDGEIAKMVFELFDADGNVIDTCVTTRKPWYWEKVLSKPGTYTINVTVYDNDGAQSSPSDPCRLTFEVTQRTLFWTVNGNAALVKGSYTFYPTIRAGLFYWINPGKWSFTLSGGAGIPLKGDPWKLIFLAEALVNGHFDKTFLGAGIGYRTKAFDLLVTDDEEIVGESGLDLVGRLGFEVFNNRKNMGDLIFELRAPLGRGFKDFHMFSVGFQFRF